MLSIKLIILCDYSLIIIIIIHQSVTIITC